MKNQDFFDKKPLKPLSTVNLVSGYYNKRTDSYLGLYGFSIRLFNYIAKARNFKLTYIPGPYSSLGEAMNTTSGEWHGALGLLHRSVSSFQIDLGILFCLQKNSQTSTRENMRQIGK